ATQLVVRFGSTGHRFVATTQVQVTSGGTVQTELKLASKLGEHHFNLSALPIGSTLEVVIQIPSPSELAKKGVPFILDVKQNVEVIRLATGAVSLRAHPTSPGNRFTGRYHPRLEGQLVNSAAGHLYYLDLDNAFLNVLPLAGVRNTNYMSPYASAVPL